MTAARKRSASAPSPAAGRDEPPRGPSTWALDDYLSYLLARASHAVAGEFHREVAAAGLTVLEWRVLATLADGRACSVGQVASIVLAQQSTVAKLLKRMEADGRVVRSAGETDRRQSLVTITRAGRAEVRRLLQRSKRHEHAIVERLSTAEAAALKESLRRLIDGR
jgi:DNA-binding MarR family transcriptional regulator